MENSVILRSQLVEAQVTGTPAVGRRYNFLEIPNLSRNNIFIYAIEAFGFNQLVSTPTGNAVIGAGATSQTPTSQVVVTLLDNQKNQFVYQMPYYSMIRNNNGGFLVYLKPRVINLTDCFIQLVNTTNIAASEVAIFNIYYFEK
jgi:hypothetical protein